MPLPSPAVVQLELDAGAGAPLASAGGAGLVALGPALLAAGSVVCPLAGMGEASGLAIAAGTGHTLTGAALDCALTGVTPESAAPALEAALAAEANATTPTAIAGS